MLTDVHTAPATAAQSAALSAGELLGIFKPRIAVSIMLSTLAGIAISPGAQPETWRAATLGLAVFLASGAAGAFNQWAEHELDARMERTAKRPFASGRIKADGRWLTAIVVLLMLAVAMAAYATNVWSAAFTFLGAFTYAVVYTVWLKPRTWWNIVVGGLAGSFAVLAGAAAVDPQLSINGILLALVLFLWTPPHFWSLAIASDKDYAAGSVPMLPLVVGNARCAKVILGHTVALSIIALMPLLFGAGWIYFVCASIGGALFTIASVQLVLEPTRRRAIRNFLASLLQLTLLIAGAIADRAIGAMA